MVRLKVFEHISDGEWLHGFNSTMVRLKAATPAFVNLYRAFQFHNGSIKSTSGSTFANTFILFQFHNGSIKSGSIKRGAAVMGTFQFHNGSIKRMPHISDADFLNRVSIPQWFD